jgi:hypothetical protein
VQKGLSTTHAPTPSFLEVSNDGNKILDSVNKLNFLGKIKLFTALHHA